MQFNETQASIIETAIRNWEAQQLISQQTADQLKKSYTIRRFDWRSIARSAFVIAIICGIIAVVSMFADRALIHIFESLVDRIYNAPNIILAVLCAIIAFVFYYLGSKRKQENPDKIFTNEGFILMGAAFTAFTAANLAKLLGSGNIYYLSVFFFAAVFYVILAVWLKNSLIWLFGLLALSSFLAAFSGISVNWSAYFWGMNIPLRFIIFSAILLAGCLLSKNIKSVRPFYHISLFYCLLLFFVSFWLTSIFGNQGSYEQWNHIPQLQFWPWALFSTAIAGLAVYLGWRYDQTMLRTFGITFVFINIYTRYFEYFWNGSYKAVFFIVLALSFWIIGRSAEKLWSVDLFNKKKK